MTSHHFDRFHYRSYRQKFGLCLRNTFAAKAGSGSQCWTTYFHNFHYPKIGNTLRKTGSFAVAAARRPRSNSKIADRHSWGIKNQLRSWRKCGRDLRSARSRPRLAGQEYWPPFTAFRSPASADWWKDQLFNLRIFVPGEGKTLHRWIQSKCCQKPLQIACKIFNRQQWHPF